MNYLEELKEIDRIVRIVSEDISLMARKNYPVNSYTVRTQISKLERVIEKLKNVEGVNV